jgi:hypothetical protein
VIQAKWAGVLSVHNYSQLGHNRNQFDDGPAGRGPVTWIANAIGAAEALEYAEIRARQYIANSNESISKGDGK